MITTTASSSLGILSDREVLEETALAVASERHATAHLIALLAEIDVRRL